MMQFKLPLVIVNFKNYVESSGDNAVALAKIVEKVAKKSGRGFAVAVSAIDLQKVVEAVSIPVLVQHVDSEKVGSSTGSILPEFVKNCGAWGTLLNHSEKRVASQAISGLVERCKGLGLVTVLCAESKTEVETFSAYGSDFIAIEPPELIGGDVSVSKANPGIISDSKIAVGESKLIVGAGIKNKEDLDIAFSLGAEGVLIASAVCKAENPEEVLQEYV